MKPMTIKQKTMVDREEMLYIINSGQIHTHANATHDDVRHVAFNQWKMLETAILNITWRLR